MRRPDLDPKIEPYEKGDGMRSGYEFAPRGYSCEGPGPSGEEPCPDQWSATVEGGPVKRCPKCRKKWAKVRARRDANKRRRSIRRRRAHG